MQTLDVISVNIWHILISLCNLLILFLIIKKFLYKPVKKTMEKRRAEISAQYEAAEKAEAEALADKAHWEQKAKEADQEAAELVKEAAATAEQRGARLMEDARQKAEGIISRAEAEAARERKNAEAEMRREIAEVSTQLAEKMLDREISADDHRRLIDSFLDEIGETDESAN